MKPKTRIWIIFLIVGLVAASLFMNSGFRKTWDRRQEIKAAHEKIQKVTEEIDRLRKGIKSLKDHPETYELYVRKELGYLKPGEKEIRFQKAEIKK